MARSIDLVDFPKALGVQEFEETIARHAPLDSGLRAIAFSYLDAGFVPLDAHIHSLCLYNQLAQAGVQVTLIWRPQDATFSYAARMGFFDVLDSRVVVEPARPSSDLTPSRWSGNPGLLEITPICGTDAARVDRIVRLVSGRVLSNLGQLADADHIAGHFATMTAELVQNIFEWSGTPLPGLIGIQRYEGSARVALTIADSGVGIAGSIREHNPDRTRDISDLDIILRAFQEGFSSRADPGGGAGLTSCAAIAERYEGRLLVRTNRTWAKLIVKDKRSGQKWKIHRTDSARIDGTILTFDLLLDRLAARPTKERLDRMGPRP